MKVGGPGNGGTTYCSNHQIHASLDFKHKIDKEALWIHDFYSPRQVQEELRERGVQSAGQLWLAKKRRNEKNVQDKPHQDEATTLVASLQACIKQKDLQRGRRLHDDIVKNGLLEKYACIGNTLVTMYAKCGALDKAQELFDNLPIRDVVSWNALISGYAQHMLCDKAFNCFHRMQSEGFLPNPVTFICVLKACCNIGALDKGQAIHTQISRDQLLSKDVHVGTALIDMYAKSGSMERALEVFNELPARNTVSWTVLIGGYAQHGLDEEALNCFDQMQGTGCSPNEVTFMCILKACGSSGAAYKGQELHAEIVRNEFTEEGMVVGTALVDMYADCGMLAEAQDVFDNLRVRDVVAWNALMGGFAQLGKDELVFNSLNKMIGEGKMPTFVTFTILLNICSHVGLLDKSQRYFEIFSNGYGILLTLEHYTCMVDLLGRAGHLETAVAIIMELPFSVNLTLWNTLLGACGRSGNMKLGRWVFEQASGLNGDDATAYICMRNIYAAARKLTGLKH